MKLTFMQCMLDCGILCNERKELLSFKYGDIIVFIAGACKPTPNVSSNFSTLLKNVKKENKKMAV